MTTSTCPGNFDSRNYFTLMPNTYVFVCKYIFDTARNRDWWTYPFLPFVDLWLEAFHRIDRKTGRGSEQGDGPHLSINGDKANGSSGGSGSGRGRRPRWSGVMGQVVYGLAPLVVVAALWRVSVAFCFLGLSGGARKRGSD